MVKFSNIQLKKLKSLKVSLVYLFGSFAEEKNSGLSDIDIGIVFSKDEINEKNQGDVYNELYFIFSDLFSGKNLDIVFLQNATLELRFDTVRHGKNIFFTSVNEKLNFEDEVSMLYADFKPILNEFNKAILRRI